MIWDQNRIIEALRRAHRNGECLSYNEMSKTQQSLVSAAAYHFGSYRAAIEKAGIDYSEVIRRPRWSRDSIVKLIKQARKNGEDLHWGAVTKRRDDLGRAAFASLQARLFGRWDRALSAAGIDPHRVSRYRVWNRPAILSAIKVRARAGKALNSGAVQNDDPGLHAAAIRHFGAFDAALHAARIDPLAVRQRRRWSRQDVLDEIRKAARQKKSLSGTAIRRDNMPLHGAAVRLFGSFRIARAKAGVQWNRSDKTHPDVPRPRKRVMV